MRRVYISFILVIMMICAAGIALLQWDAALEVFQPVAVEQGALPSLTDQLSSNQLRKEWNLARWYNRNLQEEEAYSQILDFGGGKMGYLEFPGREVYLPIFHETQEDPPEEGIVHGFGTAFPVGGRGNCPVLYCREDGIALSQGDQVRIHILDRVLTYEVTEMLTSMPEKLPEKDLCVLVLTGEGETQYFLSVRRPEKNV